MGVQEAGEYHCFLGHICRGGVCNQVWGVICAELKVWIEVGRGEVELCVVIDVAKVGC